ncbi:MAG TPA: hypothetical protein VJT73_20720 [Polyangiaceae bacterium]|nr:hypothetical protein [Polyangiaceae bacterium]
MSGFRWRTASLVATVAACGGPSVRPSAPAPRTLEEPLTGEQSAGDAPAWIVPDLRPQSTGLIDVLPDGTRRFIVAGVRVLDRPDGSIDRATEILPTGNAPRVVSLPKRVGGGSIVYVTAGSSTRLWHTKGFLDRLEPIGEMMGTVVDLVPGFDRVYARLATEDTKAFDVATGKQIGLGPLPRATRVGPLSFADAWRAVAVVDYRGALATFDAGNSWRPIPLTGVNVTQVALREGDFALETAKGRFLLGPNGEFGRDEANGNGAPTASPTGRRIPDRRLSVAEPAQAKRRPLRAAIEDGWPMSLPSGERAAVFAEAGALYQVFLPKGEVGESRFGAFREDDGICHALALGAGFGFVCGSSETGTALYAFEPPMAMREIARFSQARTVTASGNGGFVVEGSCSPAGPGWASVYCFYSPSLVPREIVAPKVSSDDAFSQRPPPRPVMLGDGRAAFVMPPAETSSGNVFIARGSSFDVTPITLAIGQEWLEHASWLDGFEERRSGTLGGWAVVGKEVRGVSVDLDGKVRLGVGAAKVETSIVAGRFAFDWGKVARGSETVDGGMTWVPVDLPTSDPLGHPNSAAGGPVGWARGDWLRVGWGSRHDRPDLGLAPATKSMAHGGYASARGLTLHCEPTGEAAGPLPKPPSPPKPSAKPLQKKRPLIEGRSPPPASVPLFVPGMPRGALPPIFAPGAMRQPPPVAVGLPNAGSGTAWSPFRGSPPPALAAGDIGLEAGTDPPLAVQARIHAWGARGSEWTRTGHVQARFDDPFELLGTHATATAPSPWPDEEKTGDALGLNAGQAIHWTALLEPAGTAALIVGQRGTARADLYAAAQGEPLAPWRDADNSPLPVPRSVVRVGPTWFFSVSSVVPGAGATNVYRVDGGVVRLLTRLPRVPSPAEVEPILVRRAASEALGLLVQGAPSFERAIRDWYVIPLDAGTGDAGEPVRLVASDLEDTTPERCAPDEDGWMVSTRVSPAPAIIVSSIAATISDIELRFRAEAGRACIDALAARAEGLHLSAHALDPSVHRPSRFGVPLAATDPSSGRRWLLKCEP